MAAIAGSFNFHIISQLLFTYDQLELSRFRAKSILQHIQNIRGLGREIASILMETIEEYGTVNEICQTLLG